MTGPHPPHEPAAEPTFRLWGIAMPAFGPSTVAAVGTGAVLPMITLSARDLGASVGVASLVLGVSGLAELGTALPAGSLVSRIGERRALMGACVLDATGAAVALSARTLWVLVAAVFAMGMTSSIFFLARQSYLTEAVPFAVRARAMSTLGGVTRIGLFVGPLIGAPIEQTWGPKAAYAVAVVSGLVAFAITWFSPDITAGHEAAERDAGRRSVKDVLWSHRRVLSTVGVGVLVIGTIRAARVTVLPLWAQSIGLSAAQTSIVFGVAGGVDMLLFYPAGSVMDRFGRVWVAVPSVVILGLGIAVLPLAHSLMTVGLVAILMAVGNGMGSGIVMTLGADNAPADGRAQFLGGWRLLSEIGGTGGPIVVSVFAAVGSLALACVVLGAISVVGGGWLVRWLPHFDPRRHLVTPTADRPIAQPLVGPPQDERLGS